MLYEHYIQEQRQRGREASIAENSARRARSSHMMQSTGVGQVRVTSPLRFQVRFLQEPVFTQGVGIINRPQGDYQDPIGQTVVRSWLRTIDGHYIGVYVTLVAQLWTPFGSLLQEAVPPSAGQVSLVHYMEFDGLAFKHLGDGVVAAAEGVEARDVGYGDADS